MSLTDTAIRALKSRDKAYKAADEKGLYLLVTPAGGRLWKLKFRAPGGIEKKLSLGGYPDVSLKDARERRDAARKQMACGIDPADQKRRDQHAAKIGAANTFSVVAEAYIARNERDGLAANTIVKRRWFVRLLQKAIGSRPISEILPFDILEAVRPDGAAKNDEKAHRTLQFIGSVYRYAIANQLATSDPTRDLRGALAMRKPSILPPFWNPSASANCCAQSMAMKGKGFRSRGSPCSFRLTCSCDPVNCAVPNGRKSIWRQPSGVFQPPR